MKASSRPIDPPSSIPIWLSSCILLCVLSLVLAFSAGSAGAAPAAGDSNITIVAGSVDTNITRTADATQATYAPNADTAKIGVDNINADLDAGLDVNILTTSVGTGTQEGNIFVNAALVKSGGDDSDISMTANNRIHVNADITNIGNGSTTLVANGTASGSFSGINVNGSAITTQGTGAISLTGKGGGADNTSVNYGIRFWLGTPSQISTVNGDITLVGTTGAGTGSTVVGIASDPTIAITIQATGSGNISLTGTSSGAEGGGVILNTGSTVQANTGDITIVGTGKASACGFGGYGTITSTGSGNVDLTGTTDSGQDACMAGSFNSGPSGSFTVNANTVQIDNTATVAGNGFLTFAPRTAGTTIGLGGGTGILNLADAELTQLTDGFSSITIGKSDAGNITVDTASFTDPLTLVTGGSIVDAGTGGPHITVADLLLDSGTGVGSLADPVDIEVTNLAARATTSGGVFIEDDSALTVKTVGGVNGISANGGDIVLTANGSASGNFIGLTVDGSAITTLGAGAISLTGNGGDTGDGNSGIHFIGTNPQISTVNGDITLVGTTGTGTGVTVVGIVSDPTIAITIQATGAGNISLTGTSSGAEGGGVILNTGSTVQANTGDITIVGTGKAGACGFGGFGTITSMGAVNTSGKVDLTGTTDSGPDACMAGPFNSGPSGSFTVNANTVQIDNTATVAGNGFLTFAPRTVGTTIGLGGGAGTLSLTQAELDRLADGFYSITIGNSDAGDITVNTATFLDDVKLTTAGKITDGGATGTDVTAPSVWFEGALSPGASPGTFEVVGNVVFPFNSSFNVELGANLAASHDLLDVTGDVSILGSVTLNLIPGSFADTSSGTITIINNRGGNPIDTFLFFKDPADRALTEGSQVAPGGTPNFLISYVGGTGNDVVLTNTDPTAVQLADFRASSDDNATLAWETLNESGLSGFHVWRGSVEKAETRLTDTLIGAAGGLNGQVYTWQDANAPTWGETAQYWLEAVEANGSSTFTGPVEVLGIGRLFLPSIGR